jgi:hypothetical protein
LVEQNIAIEVHDRIRALAPTTKGETALAQDDEPTGEGLPNMMVCTCDGSGGECLVHYEEGEHPNALLLAKAKLANEPPRERECAKCGGSGRKS